MSRDIQSTVSAAIDQQLVKPFIATELEFDGGNILRLWTGYGTLNISGEDWFGTGNLLEISSVEESAEISSKGCELTLSAVPSEILSLALSEPYQGRVCNIYLGVFTGSTPQVDDEGKLLKEDSDYILLENGDKILLEDAGPRLTEIFTGYMDQMDIEEGPDYSIVTLKVENRLIDLERARSARYTSGDQNSKFPNDRGLDFVESLQGKEIFFGRKSN